MSVALYFILCGILGILLWLSTKNLVEHDQNRISCIPYKIPIYRYIITAVFIMIPVANIFTAVWIFAYMCFRFEEGEKGSYDGLYLKENRFNWLYITYKLLSKKI